MHSPAPVRAPATTKEVTGNHIHALSQFTVKIGNHKIAIDDKTGKMQNRTSRIVQSLLIPRLSCQSPFEGNPAPVSSME
jgi:hypothetical protein